jgi:hypothetical protein
VITVRALDDAPQKQRDRLAFIELQAWFCGEVSRKDVVNRFGIQTAAATRDLALYRELSPDNLLIDQREKVYRISDGFSPLFAYSASRITTWLSQGFGDEEHLTWSTGIPCTVSEVLSQPKIEILAAVCRAIRQQQAIEVRYESLNRCSTRVIVPFALHSNGHRWHARAFDRETGEFRDFVVTRILSVTTAGQAGEHEQASEDDNWTRRVELELVPHPNLERKEPVLCDYNFDDAGVMRVKVRAAVAGYTLRQWGVDCSCEHTGSPREFQLWLRNRQALYGVPNLILAPGYELS